LGKSSRFHQPPPKASKSAAVSAPASTKTIKEQAEAVLSALGLTVSDAFRIFLTRVAHERALPFAPFVPNAKTMAATKEARRGKHRSFDTVDDLIRDLDAQN
jgi:DNA-damage-inducible protein J